MQLNEASGHDTTRTPNTDLAKWVVLILALGKQQHNISFELTLPALSESSRI